MSNTYFYTTLTRLLLQSQPWYDVAFRIVLLGNPMIIWLDLLVLVAVCFFLVRLAYIRRRKPPAASNKGDVP